MGTSRAIIIAGALIAAAITATVIDSPSAPETVYVSDGGGGFFVINPATKESPVKNLDTVYFQSLPVVLK